MAIVADILQMSKLIDEPVANYDAHCIDSHADDKAKNNEDNNDGVEEAESWGGGQTSRE
jgi:hypothetical protein